MTTRGIGCGGWRDRAKSFWLADGGQDLVEYALLAAFIGLTAYGGFFAIRNTIFSSYGTWDTNQQNLWVPPDPGSFGT